MRGFLIALDWTFADCTLYCLTYLYDDCCRDFRVATSLTGVQGRTGSGCVGCGRELGSPEQIYRILHCCAGWDWTQDRWVSMSVSVNVNALDERLESQHTPKKPKRAPTGLPLGTGLCLCLCLCLLLWLLCLPCAFALPGRTTSSLGLAALLHPILQLDLSACVWS